MGRFGLWDVFFLLKTTSEMDLWAKKDVLNQHHLKQFLGFLLVIGQLLSTCSDRCSLKGHSKGVTVSQFHRCKNHHQRAQKEDPEKAQRPKITQITHKNIPLNPQNMDVCYKKYCNNQQKQHQQKSLKKQNKKNYCTSPHPGIIHSIHTFSRRFFISRDFRSPGEQSGRR